MITRPCARLSRRPTDGHSETSPTCPGEVSASYLRCGHRSFADVSLDRSNNTQDETETEGETSV